MVWQPGPACRHRGVDRTVRWVQCVLGALTAALYFLFALRAFESRRVAALTGLFCAFHPYWIIDTAQVNDGVLASFLLGLTVFLGARAAQWGGALASVLYGLGLAGLALVRAALLPFTIVALLWFLLRCRTARQGWLYVILAFLGFVTGLACWTFRNYRAFGEIIPVADSTYLHLWMGNNARATGGPESESTMLQALAAQRGEPQNETAEQVGQLSQKERYDQLGRATWKYIRSDPAGALKHRFEAVASFLLGEQWLRDRILWKVNGPESGSLPDWLAGSYPAILYGSLFGMFTLALLGWRWSYAWRHEMMPASLALIWVPLPYILSHAGVLQGPRLPLDGVLLCYAAFALVCLASPLSNRFFGGPQIDLRPEVRRRL
jgi:4-amino-4-deoxy-L-arabinose transferase-like glycosyltransferase